MPVIPSTRRLRQERPAEFKANLIYIGNHILFNSRQSQQGSLTGQGEAN